MLAHKSKMPVKQVPQLPHASAPFQRASYPGRAPLTPELILQMQRNIGNRKVMQLLQAQKRAVQPIQQQGQVEGTSATEPEHEKKEFKAGNETHHLWIEQNGGKMTVMVASVPQVLMDLLDSDEVQERKEELKGKGADLDQLKSELEQIESISLEDLMNWKEYHYDYKNTRLASLVPALIILFENMPDVDSAAERGAIRIRENELITQTKALAKKTFDLIEHDAEVAGAPWIEKMGKYMKDLGRAATYLGLRIGEDGVAVETDAERKPLKKPALDKIQTVLQKIEAQVAISGKILFGQVRANKNFAEATNVNTSEGVAGRLVVDVAKDLEEGKMDPNTITVQVFEHEGKLVTVNNRGLAALSLAKMRPVNVIKITPSNAERDRLKEVETFKDANKQGPNYHSKLPSEHIPLTGELNNLEYLVIASAR